MLCDFWNMNVYTRIYTVYDVRSVRLQTVASRARGVRFHFDLSLAQMHVRSQTAPARDVVDVPPTPPTSTITTTIPPRDAGWNLENSNQESESAFVCAFFSSPSLLVFSAPSAYI